jgi:predicted RNA polymerase sigma factor
LFLFVAAGAKIAPRYRLTTAIVLAAMLVVHSFWGHVLANQPPQVTSYQLIIAALQQIALQGIPAGGPVRHFIQEALGAVLGIVYIFWSEKAKGRVAST